MLCERSDILSGDVTRAAVLMLAVGKYIVRSFDVILLYIKGAGASLLTSVSTHLQQKGSGVSGAPGLPTSLLGWLL